MKNKYKKILAVATAFAVAVAGLMIQPNRTYADGEEVELLTNREFINGDGWTLSGYNGTPAYNGDGSVTVNVEAKTGGNNWSTQLVQNNLTLVQGKYYRASVTITSDVARSFQLMIQSDGSNGGNWSTQYDDSTFSVAANTEYTFTKTFKATSVANSYLYGIMMGYVGNSSDACTVTISNVSFKQLSDEECSSIAESESIAESISIAESQSIAESISIAEQESRDAANAARPWVTIGTSSYQYKVLDGRDDSVNVKPEIHAGDVIYVAFTLAATFQSVKLDNVSQTPRAGADFEIPFSSINDGNEHTLTVVNAYGSDTVSVMLRYVVPEAATTTSAITEPAEVFGLTVTSTAVGQIEVNWGANSTYEAAGQTYKIYLNGTEERTATTAGLQTFTGLTPGASVTVKVTAILGVNETSGQTAIITVMAPAATTTAPVETTSAPAATNTIRTEDEVMVSDSISIQGFQIKTNFAEGDNEKDVAFRAIAKCPSIGTNLTMNEETYQIKAHGIIYTVDDNGDGYKKNNVQTKSDTKLNLASADAVSGGRTIYLGSAPNDGRTFGITSTDLALIPSLNTNNDGHDYYVFTMNGLKSCMTHSYHVRAFAIVTKDETDYIVYGTKAAVTSVPQIADNIYRNNKSPNVQGHQYLFSFLSNALNTGYDIPTTNPYYRTTTIEYGWDGNLHEEETTTKFEGMTFVPGS